MVRESIQWASEEAAERSKRKMRDDVQQALAHIEREMREELDGSRYTVEVSVEAFRDWADRIGALRAELKASIDAAAAQLAENNNVLREARDLLAAHARDGEDARRLLPDVFAERLRDGWSFAYEPGTNYVGLNHPHGGKQSVVRVEYGNYDEQIGNAIAALFNAATQEAARG